MMARGSSGRTAYRSGGIVRRDSLKTDSYRSSPFIVGCHQIELHARRSLTAVNVRQNPFPWLSAWLSIRPRDTGRIAR
jgi:hypothetical protein